MEDKPRLIEVAFPLKQTSLDSVHEKNVRHGHISTLHIWPARRPLAACRAALIATLLPDPGNEEERKKLLERLAGKVVKKVQKDGSLKEETEGGILHWGRESGPDLQWFRDEIRKAYGGRAPKVLDPFAGGGAIPLEAMRLGCEATAIDINPVAWFILKCTLEYPQKLAGQKLPLPDFAASDPEFMEAYFKQTGGGKVNRKKLQEQVRGIQMQLLPPPDADLAWHVRAWGLWVLKHARKELASFYPTYADYQPLQGDLKHEPRAPRLVPFNPDGNPDVASLNVDYGEEYLKNPQNPRWVAKPTVAYLWARTVKCKNCRAIVPLLKTRWLCKKEKKRAVLEMDPNADKSGVVFRVNTNPPTFNGNKTQKAAFDKRLGEGTMSRSGVQCPCCNAIMTMEDIRAEGKRGRMNAVMTALVVEGSGGKEYRPPQSLEIAKAEEAQSVLKDIFCQIPGGVPNELIGADAKGSTWCREYGIDGWHQLFTSRQNLLMGTLILQLRRVKTTLDQYGYNNLWSEAVASIAMLSVGRLADFSSCGVTWQNGGEFLGHTFVRYAIPLVWDYCEGNPLGNTSGNYDGAINWISRVVSHLCQGLLDARVPTVINSSALEDCGGGTFDIIVTDPPYYDAIPYATIMDYFYVWHRRGIVGNIRTLAPAFSEPLTPKWDHERCDGELVDDAARFQGDKAASKLIYENGMSSVFQQCHGQLQDSGRMVIVFAHKHPDAWETLAAALIRAGFVVDASWPIHTERVARTRALSSAALSSSLWLVCKKRPASARPGWETQVLEDMRVRITERLRYFWDAGIRGPDFVWAATGPALEAYSKHPVVRKADQPDATMSVSEFLQHVRRMVVDFAVGRILSRDGGDEAVTGLDDVTIYYLLHRNDFGLDEAPSGACIMYALSCGLSDKALADQFGIIQMKDSRADNGASPLETEEVAEDEEVYGDQGADDAEPDEVSSGGKVKLVPWNKRTKKTLGLTAPGGRPIPLIDQIHRLMHLWKAGDVNKVNDYLDERALRNNKLFHQLLQALIELCERNSQERSLLESISNHVQARGERHEDGTIGTTEVYTKSQ